MKNIFKHKISGLIILAVGLFSVSSCKKYLEIPGPANSVTTDAVLTTKTGVNNFMVGIYAPMSNVSGYALFYLRATGLMSDDWYNPTLGSYLLSEQSCILDPKDYWAAAGVWPAFYQIIYQANTAIEQLPAAPASALDTTTKKAYIAAAKTIRAWAHYLLVRTWGDVPLILTTDVTANNKTKRTPKADVYAQIVTDLKAAMADLPTDPSTLTNAIGDGGPRYINNKFIPEAILSEVYLDMGKWADAETACTDIIQNGKYSLAAIGNVFFRSSTETIMSIGSNATSSDAYVDAAAWQFFMGPPYAPSDVTEPSQLSPTLLSTFETGDLRLTNWTKNLYGNTWMYKYVYNFFVIFTPGMVPAGKEQDLIYIRLAEIYLNRAEARAQLGKVATASNPNDNTVAAYDVNQIRTRAGLANTTAATQTDMLAAILHERQVELFGEGRRWNDLIRFGKADAVLGAIPYKAPNWKTTNKLWPLPASEINKGTLLTQNPGY